MSIGLDRGEPIPESRLIPNATRPCGYCHGLLHFGWCDPMRDEYEANVRDGQPRIVPLTRM